MLALVRQGDVQGYIQPWHVAEGGIEGPGFGQTLADSIKAGTDAYAKAAMGPEQRKCYETLEYRIAELCAQGADENKLAEVRKTGEQVCSHPPSRPGNTYCVPFDRDRMEICPAYDGVRCVMADWRNGLPCGP